MLGDQLGDDRVFPQSRGVVGIETSGPPGVQAHGDQRQRVRVATDQRCQGGRGIVARMVVLGGPEDDEGCNRAITGHRIDLRAGSDLLQGDREGLVELDSGIVDALGILVAADHQRLPGRPPEQLDQLSVIRPIHRVGQLVETEGEVGFGFVLAPPCDVAFSDRSIPQVDADCSNVMPRLTALPTGPSSSTVAGSSASSKCDKDRPQFVGFTVGDGFRLGQGQPLLVGDVGRCLRPDLTDGAVDCSDPAVDRCACRSSGSGPGGRPLGGSGLPPAREHRVGSGSDREWAYSTARREASISIFSPARANAIAT